MQRKIRFRDGKIQTAFAAFLINWSIAFFAFLLFLIKNNGLMSLSNDFDAQCLTFQTFANQAVREGRIFFHWAIDIGSDFIASFSFYNLGSPFFWITLLFPPEAFPYLVAWVLMLKYAVAGLTSCLYIRQYVSSSWCAVAGSVLYAWSGYQAANIVFYHFHDVTAFFPLLLLGLDYAVQTKKYGKMALAVWINALVNWNFFIGEVIFLAVYYVIRYETLRKLKERRFGEVFKQVGHCAAEGMLGVGMAAVLFVPSVYAIFSNTRISDHILGADALAFSTQDYLQMLKALILPNETLCNQSVLETSNWYSIAAYLPLVGVIYTAAYVWKHKNDWVSTLLKISLLTACIPVLNNCFTLFNVEPYRRWYYMPVLIMALASVRIWEQAVCDRHIGSLIQKSAMVSIGITAMLAIYLTQYRWSADRENSVNNPVAFCLYLALGVAGAAAAVMLAKYAYQRKYVIKLFLFFAVGAGCINLMLNIVRYHQNSDFASTKDVYNEIIKSSENLQSDVLPYRYAFSNADAYYNRGFAGSLTSVDSFISTVDAGIFEFYDAIAAHRHTITIDGSDGTNELLSAKYYFTFEPWETKDACSVYHNGSREFYVYNDAQALPIGFTYRFYMTRSEFDRLEPRVRSRAMLHALVIADEEEDQVSQILQHVPTADTEFFTKEQKEKDIAEHLQECSTGFTHSTREFSSVIHTNVETFGFFSVPYSSRWSAKVNGKDAEVFNINGLMAVPLEKGENTIHFTYHIGIVLAGLAVSVFSFGIVICIFIFGKRAGGSRSCRRGEAG